MSELDRFRQYAEQRDPPRRRVSIPWKFLSGSWREASALGNEHLGLPRGDVARLRTPGRRQSPQPHLRSSPLLSCSEQTRGTNSC
jgi:hypothetical protein